MSVTVWSRLGISPTRDRLAVRRAYAERLKQTNPEDDPEGFQALRQAYEAVLAQLVRAPSAPLEDAPASEDAPSASPAAAELAPPDPFAAHWQACHLLEQWIAEGPPAGRRLAEALAAVLASPVMENLAVRANTERGLARLILTQAPRADALIPQALDCFHWGEGRASWDEPAEFRAVHARSVLAGVLERARARTSRHRKACGLLAAPPPKGLAAIAVAAMHVDRMQAFFNYLNRECPAALREFDQASVAFWSERIGRSGRFLRKRRRARPMIRKLRMLSGLVIGLILLLRLLSAELTPAAQPRLGVASRGSGVLLAPGRTAPSPLAAQALAAFRAGQPADAARDYALALERDPGDAQARFGLGMARMRVGDDHGMSDKLQALAQDPGVVARFEREGLPPQDLAVYDLPPRISAQPAAAEIARLTPRRPLESRLSVPMRCLVDQAGRIHDCALQAALPAPLAPFGRAARRIVELGKAEPATYRGRPALDAPVSLAMVFEPPRQAP